MDYAAGGRERRQRPVPVLDGLGLRTSRRAGGGVPVRVMAGVQVVLLLLLLVGCATHDRQDVMVADPEWPPEIFGAITSGVISAGMSPDMVRAAWGRPTRISFNGNGLNQYNTWHYEGRQHNADMIGGPTGGTPPLVEWTVSFANGWVVEWTD